MKFGIVAVIAGALGVPLGSFVASRLKARLPNADPLVCAAGLLFSVPMIFFAMLTPRGSPSGTFTLVFFGMLLLNLNWSIVADMLLVCPGVFSGKMERDVFEEVIFF